MKKNIRIHFVNGENADITAANLETESFSLTESLCSRDEFRFGLCESSVATFTTIDVGNIKGALIEIQHEIDVSSLEEEPEETQHPEDLDFPVFPIKYGLFKIDECTRQADSNSRKVVAYTPEAEKISGYEKRKAEFSYTSKTYNVDLNKYIMASLKISDFEGEEINGEQERKDLQGFYRYIANYTVYKYTQDELYKVMLGEYNPELGRTIDEVQDTLTKKCIEALAEHYQHGSYVTIRLDINWIIPAAYIEGPGGRYSLSEIDTIYTKHPDEITEQYYIYVPQDLTFYYQAWDGQSSYWEEIYNTRVRTSENHIQRYIPDYDTPITLKIPMKKGENKKCYIDTEYIKNNFNDIIETAATNAIYNRNGGYFFHDIETMCGLYPSEELYPNSELYPSDGQAYDIGQGLYYSVQYADEKTKPFGRVGLTYGDDNYIYKDIAEDYQNNTENYNLYSLSQNEVLRGLAETDLATTKKFMNSIAEQIQKIRYTPATIKMKGLPYLQAGDLLEVSTAAETFETLILRRTLRGIQSLEDIIEARGE